MLLVSLIMRLLSYNNYNYLSYFSRLYSPLAFFAYIVFLLISSPFFLRLYRPFAYIVLSLISLFPLISPLLFLYRSSSLLAYIAFSLILFSRLYRFFIYIVLRFISSPRFLLFILFS